MKVVFNFGLQSSRVASADSQKEYDILIRLPEHRNLVRIVFAFIDRPPMWMVSRLPDPSLVCEDQAIDAAGNEIMQPGGP